MIYDRGGRTPLGALEQLTQVQWSRVRDDISTAEVQIINPSKECQDIVNLISPNRHELVIFRGEDRVWEGPITLVGRNKSEIKIDARDVVHYCYRTVCHLEHDDSFRWIPDSKDKNRVESHKEKPIVDRIYNILMSELDRKEGLDPPINVQQYITKVRADDISLERKANRRTLAWATTVFDEMESAAQYGGLDYTVVGRRIILNDVRVELGIGPTITEDELLGATLTVTSYGMDHVTRSVTSGENGAHSVAGGIDDFYGEWETLENMVDQDSEEAPSQDSLDNAAGYILQGKRYLPTLVHVPDNSRINPSGTISLQDLVPGVIFPVRAELPSMTLTQYEKLNQVTVKETGEGEEISITLGPPPSSPLEHT